jgi:hypothetical protein
VKAGSNNSPTWAIVLNSGGGDFDNTVINNNELLNAMTGIQFVGFPLGTTNNGLISGNIFGSDDVSVTLGNVGLHVSNADGLVISGNTIKNLFNNSNPKGINIGINTVNTTVKGNTINGIVYIGSYGGGGKGIDVNTGSMASNITISNNSISNVSGDGWNSLESNSIVGIRLMGNTGGINLFFNSVSLSGATSRPAALSDVSSAFYAAATVSNLDIRNNIFANSIDNLTGLSRAFSIYSDAPASAYTKINYNDYNSSGEEAILGYLDGPVPSLGAWQAASLQDDFSLNQDPLFVSSSDLHPTNEGIDHQGYYLSLYSQDLSGIQRTNPPDMGAFEFGINPEVATLSSSRINCEGGTLNGTIDANGLTVQAYFDYGPDTNYGNSVAATPAIVTGTNTESISAAISMPPLTTFHYRARGITDDGVTVVSNDQTLTTLAAGTPVTITFPATNISEFAATLNGSVNARCNPATILFEYGLTTGYGSLVYASEDPLTGDTTWLVSADISGLEVNSLYHFRCLVQYPDGTTYGEDQVFNTVCPVAVPTISGPGTACTSLTSEYNTESGMADYAWTVSDGGQILSGEGTDSVVILWNSEGEQSLTVTYSSISGCPSASPATMSVMVNLLPEPTIYGSDVVCATTGMMVYTTQPGFNNYTWSVSSGGTIVTGLETYQVEVNWTGPGDNSVTVNYANASGCYAPSPASMPVEVLPYPGNAGPITGTTVLCAGTRSVSYSVEPIPNVSEYIWVLPTGVTITEGENTNTIIVSFSTEAKTGLMTVYGRNICGAGQESPSLLVTVHSIPPAPQVSIDEFNMLHSSSPEGNQWYFNGMVIEGANGQDYQPEESGTYYTIVTFNDCPSGLSNIVEVILTGMGELNGPEISIFPVPNRGRFTVSFSTKQEETFSILVFDALGTNVYELRNVPANGKFLKTIELTDPSQGIYTVVIQGKDYAIQKKILVIK